MKKTLDEKKKNDIFICANINSNNKTRGKVMKYRLQIENQVSIIFETNSLAYAQKKAREFSWNAKILIWGNWGYTLDYIYFNGKLIKNYKLGR